VQPLSILLPGLDGTGNLFKRFTAVVPADWPVQAVRLPNDQPRGYRDLADCLLPMLPTGRFAIVAESFSGPLAILLANRCPQVYAVVLSATFAEPPLPRVFARLSNLFGHRPPPVWALRAFMAGGDLLLAEAVRNAVGEVDGAVLRARLAAALSVDVAGDLQHLRQPLLCLRAARDRLVPAHCATTIRSLNPSAESASIDGPHLLLQTKPVESWRHIESFLRRASARALANPEVQTDGASPRR
jgi:pimeloyl-[acyl-carrier protein] methyl ester esterase